MDTSKFDSFLIKMTPRWDRMLMEEAMVCPLNISSLNITFARHKVLHTHYQETLAAVRKLSEEATL